MRPKTATVLPSQKQYHELTFTDNFMFCKIMTKNHKLCKQLLELILGIKIKKIVSAEREEILGVTPEGKSIRLDVYVEDEAGTVYNIEMQASSRKNLPKRTRYYQGMIDLNLIEKGADYNELKKSFIIFICTFDFFQKGLPIYTFTNRCKEMTELEMGDETVKIFVNPYGDTKNLTEDMKAFLKYLKGEITEGNELINVMEQEVESARYHEEWRVEYMTLMMEYREKYKEGKEAGMEEGIEKGIEKGIEALVLDNLEEQVPKERILVKLQKRFELSRESAEYYFDRFAK